MILNSYLILIQYPLAEVHSLDLVGKRKIIFTVWPFTRAIFIKMCLTEYRSNKHLMRNVFQGQINFVNTANYVLLYKIIYCIKSSENACNKEICLMLFKLEVPRLICLK